MGVQLTSLWAKRDPYGANGREKARAKGSTSWISLPDPVVARPAVLVRFASPQSFLYRGAPEPAPGSRPAAGNQRSCDLRTVDAREVQYRVCAAERDLI